MREKAGDKGTVNKSRAAYFRAYRAANREHVRELHRQHQRKWAKANRPYIRKQRNAWHCKKYRTDEVFRERAKQRERARYRVNVEHRRKLTMERTADRIIESLIRRHARVPGFNSLQDFGNTTDMEVLRQRFRALDVVLKSGKE
jgi:hypothetical protein